MSDFRLALERIFLRSSLFFKYFQLIFFPSGAEKNELESNETGCGEAWDEVCSGQWEFFSSWDNFRANFWFPYDQTVLTRLGTGIRTCLTPNQEIGLSTMAPAHPTPERDQAFRCAYPPPPPPPWDKAFRCAPPPLIWLIILCCHQLKNVINPGKKINNMMIANFVRIFLNLVRMRTVLVL